MTIILRRPSEIAIMREAGRIVAQAFALIEEAIGPGVRLSDLDKLVANHLERCGAQTLYLGYQGSPATHPPFPGVICASINQEICHGLPDDRILEEGNIVGIDIGLRYKGYCGDACVTYGIGQISPEAEQLLTVTKAALHKGIAAAQKGKRLTDIGAAIQKHAESHGYSVVREWGGHSIGRELHEGLSVPHVGPGGRGPKLRTGMVFTIEPMINAGAPGCLLLDDGWTVVTLDGQLSAQFEHTIAITDNGPEILSLP
jgi:methionyl aminopeptidase